VNRWTSLSVALVSGVLLLATACGGGGTAAPSASRSAASTPGSVTTSSGSPGPTVNQGPNGQLVFSPTSLSVHQGETITIANVSPSAAHTFTIKGQKINVVNQPGQSATQTIGLAPGTYTFICTFHVKSGMMGTLTVSG
jgi:plastocyanin